VLCATSNVKISPGEVFSFVQDSAISLACHQWPESAQRESKRLWFRHMMNHPDSGYNYEHV